MDWTKNAPKRRGWYWLYTPNTYQAQEPEAVYVWVDGPSVCCSFGGTLKRDFEYVQSIDGLWCGPIVEPKLPK